MSDEMKDPIVHAGDDYLLPACEAAPADESLHVAFSAAQITCPECMDLVKSGDVEQIEIERGVSAPAIVLSGDTRGGRRELIISVGGEQVGRFDYEECGWTFRRHAQIIEALGAALGVLVIDETK